MDVELFESPWDMFSENMNFRNIIVTFFLSGAQQILIIIIIKQIN